MKIEEALQTNKFRDQKHKGVLNLLYTAYWMKIQINSVLKSYNLTNEQFNVLRILRGSLPKHLCVKDIAERMIEKSPNVPRILERLFRDGLIERKQSETDRRESVSIISAKALGILASLDQKIIDKENESMKISEQEAEILNRLLEQIRSSD
jgi:DNA-binding MarR family transcriptional regulator